ncbi:MAG: type II restriction endonuclease [Prochloraceae cyanobacterium]
MKLNPVFQQYLNCSNEPEIFQYLQDTLTDSITLWDYFVNWDKVLNNYREIEINLNLLNYLVGKENIEEELRLLLNKYPNVVSVIPILLACRNSNFKILTSYIYGEFNYKFFDFQTKNKFTKQEIDSVIEFANETGVLKLFKNKVIKSIPDYVLGIEVGLDTNARKNRSGTTMEKIVENLLKKIKQQQNLSLISQATSEKIKKEWGIEVKVDKSSRRFDFAIKNNDILYLIETNFYSGAGSKLKSTAGEYKTVFDFISSQGHKFIWITDGLGWKKVIRPLEETFDRIDYLLNLKMASSGLLAAIISQKL